MLKNFSLKAKVISICLGLVAIVLVVGAVNFAALGRISKSFGHVADINLPNIRHIDRMKEEFALARVHVRTFGIPELSAEEKSVATEGFKHAIAEFELAEKEFLEIPFQPGEEEAYQRIKAPWDDFKRMGAEVIRLNTSATQADIKKMHDIFHHDCPRVAKQLHDALDRLADLHVRSASLAVERAHSLETFANRLSLAIALIGIAIGLSLSIAFANALSRTLDELAATLLGGADELASAATEISATSEELSTAASQQASSLQETAASVEEMSAMVSHNADNAVKSSEISQASQITATRGKQVVEQMVEAIGEIDRSNREISDVIKVIAQIGNKTKVIDDIVFKTQLLSFNASVEAARAGEHGKGFAVVAEEVGNLAQMSGTAAREISEMLDQSLEKVERMISASKAKVESGMIVSKSCGEVLDELVRSVADVNGMTNQIAASSREQAKGVAEINKAMSQLDQVTQQNASAAQQSASAAEQLTQQADAVRASVQGLNALVKGDGSGAALGRSHTPRSFVPARRGRAAGRSSLSAVEKLPRGVPSGKSSGFDEAA